MSQEYSQAYLTQNSEVLETASAPISSTQVITTTSSGTSSSIPKKLKKTLPKKNSFSLTYTDSVKLNLITQKTGSDYYFENNVLTQTVNPLNTLGNHELYIWIDSLQCFKTKAEIFRIDSILNAPQIISISDTLTQQSDTLTLVSPEKVAPPVEVEKKVESHIQIPKDQKVKAASSFHDSKLFLFIVVLFSIGLLGYTRLKSSRFLKTIFKGLFSYHESKKLFTTVNIRNSIHSVMLDLLFSVNMGILIYEIASMSMSVRGYLFSFLVFAGSVLAVSIYFLVKNSLYRLIGFIFSTSEETNEYIFFVGIVNKTFGIIITPILIILPFTTGSGVYITMGIALAAYGILYTIQLLRGLKIIFKKASSLFYYILYLCTLEILPLIIAYRFLNK